MPHSRIPEMANRYNTETRIATLYSWGPSDYDIRLLIRNPYLLRDIFGFRTKCVMKREQKPVLYIYPLSDAVSDRPASLEYVTSMYVYSSLVKHQLVGNTEAPLLGIVPIQNRCSNPAGEGIQEYYAFNPPVYVPLWQATFRDVRIELKTDWGEPFPFLTSPSQKVATRLHFRRRDRKFL